MGKDKVITVMCAARLPELLVKRIDSAAASGGVSRAQFIAEACRMRLDGIECPGSNPGHVARMESRLDSVAEGSSAGRKPDMQALREICAPQKGREFGPPTEVEVYSEIPICSKKWWEDGTQYECLMDKGHKEQKHGLRGMARALDA